MSFSSSSSSDWEPLSPTEVAARSLMCALQGLFAAFAAAQLVRIRLVTKKPLLGPAFASKKLFHLFLLLLMLCRFFNNLFVLASPCYRVKDAFASWCFIVNVASVRPTLTLGFFALFLVLLFWSRYLWLLNRPVPERGTAAAHRAAAGVASDSWAKSDTFWPRARIGVAVVAVIVVAAHIPDFVLLLLWETHRSAFLVYDNVFMVFGNGLFVVMAVGMTFWGLWLNKLVYHRLSSALMNSARKIAALTITCAVLLVARSVWALAVIIPAASSHVSGHMWPTWQTVTFELLEAFPLVLMCILMNPTRISSSVRINPQWKPLLSTPHQRLNT